MESILEPAETRYLWVYYIFQLVASAGHLFLALLTIFSRQIAGNGVMLNFYGIFSVTLFFDAILLYTGHIYHKTDSIPSSIRIINASIRMSGMLANACTTLTVVMRVFTSVNAALGTPLAKYLVRITDTILIIIPWTVSVPFLIAYLVQTISNPEKVVRTKYFCSFEGATITEVTSNLTLALMSLLLVLAVLTAVLLIRLRISQHGLVYINTSTDLVIGCRILLFGLYSLTTVTILSGTLNHRWSGFSDGPTLTFALTGFWAFLLFFIQPDTFDALKTCFGLRRKHRRPSFSSITASRPQQPMEFSPVGSPMLSPTLGEFGELRSDDFSLNNNKMGTWSSVPRVHHRERSIDRIKEK